MRIALRSVLFATFMTAGAASGASADASGVYICVDANNTPLGRLRVSGDQYSWTKTNPAFDDVDSVENGSGDITYDGNYIFPQSGPMLEWDATGVFGDNSIGINNNGGRLMNCRVVW